MKRGFIFGFCLACTLIACASFKFDRYGLDLAKQKLLHYESAAKDLPLSTCDNSDGKFKCVVLFSDEFYRLKNDYEQLVAQLAECQGK